MSLHLAQSSRNYEVLDVELQSQKRINNLLQLTRSRWMSSSNCELHTWTQQRLKRFVQQEMQDVEIILLSQREPYVHHANSNGVRLERPAGGLVTALEPVMSACAGTWIAHGSGSADFQMVSKDHHIAVPPDKPMYTLRRLELSDEEINGHYLGLCNRTIWPLCNQAYVRPVFRESDWDAYKAVNQRFCNAILEEAKTENPLILVQDYHLALVPQMLRMALPKATIATFWHIPWPSPKAFEICPWSEQLLQGLLCSDVLGFQTQQHVKNFSDTVTQMMKKNALRPLVKAYPISIAWPSPAEWTTQEITQCRKSVLQTHGLSANARLGVGVDRMDYTKGISEKFLSIERLLEREPNWIGRFTFIQILSPSRLRVPEYRAYRLQIVRLADRINRRFGTKNYQPIVLVLHGKTQEQVYRYYRASDFCFVSSVDDGMNLVSKEFIAARDDLNGVLLLSKFAGASKELTQALLVNPYDPNECADAISQALTMQTQEQSERLQAMRIHVAEHNVFRWAGDLLGDSLKIHRRHELVNDAA